MGFLNWMLPGFLLAAVIGAIIISSIFKNNNGAKIGLTFFYSLIQFIYLCQHLIIYFGFNIQEIPEELHTYALRQWTEQEELGHQVTQIKNQIRNTIAEIRGESTCCASAYQSPKNRQFWIGFAKGIAAIVMIFPLGGFILKRFCDKDAKQKQKMKQQQQGTTTLVIENNQMPNQMVLMPQTVPMNVMHVSIIDPTMIMPVYNYALQGNLQMNQYDGQMMPQNYNNPQQQNANMMAVNGNNQQQKPQQSNMNVSSNVLIQNSNNHQEIQQIRT